MNRTGLTAIFLAAFLFPANGDAESRPAQCLLEVKGVHYLGGDCLFTPLDRSGSFRITALPAKRLIAQVDATKKDEGKALWNGPSGGDAPVKELGDATRSGGCWTLSDSDSDDYNDSRICAWSLADKVYLGPSPGKPDPRSTIYYGSRVGMYDEIADRQNIDTPNAQITAKPSQDAAVKFCREYSRDYSQKCISEQLRNSPSGVIRANCQDKSFSNFDGYKYKFLGKAEKNADKNIDAMMAEFSIRYLATGEILDGSTASGYDVALGIYQALCPASAPKPSD